MQNWTIGKRIATGFAAVLIIMLALGIFVRTRVQTIKAEMADVADVGLPTLELLGEAKCLALETRMLVYKHISSPSQADMRELEAKISTDSAQITTDLNEYQKLINVADMHFLDQVKATRENYRSLREQILAASRNATNTEATAQVYRRARAELDPLATTYAEALSRCEEQEKKEGEDDAAQVTAAIHGTNLGLLIGITAALITASILSFLIGRSTKRVLQTVSNSLSDAANQVSTAAGQVSSASQTLAGGASEQASSLEEASASLEEMTSMTKRNCANTGNANTLAKEARAVADKGVNDMQTMSAAMAAIKGSSDDIAKIIKTIDEIAFQTNILALNAAVEAARAGEAGMGFAVVADEVRNLAQRCAQAARETSSKIEDAIAKTGQGVEISKKVSVALNEIVVKVRQVDDLVAEVAGASKEQTDGITQINAAVGQMDKVTQGNAATAEESAAAAEELNAQAATMKESVAELMKLVGNAVTTEDRYPVKAPSKTTGFIPRITAPVPMKSKVTRYSEIPLENGFKDF